MLARLLLLFFALAFIEVHAKKSQNVVLRVCPEENLPTDDPHEPPHLCQDFEMTGSGLDMKSIREMIRVETAALIKKDWYDKKIREKKYEDAVKLGMSEEDIAEWMEGLDGGLSSSGEDGRREATITKDYEPATPTSISLRSLASGEGDFAKLNNLLNKVTIVIPDPDPIFAVDADELTTLVPEWGGIGLIGLGFQVWASVTNINLSRINIGNIQFDHSKSADNSFVEIDITLENIGLEADINWAYWLCECYIGGDCSDEYIFGSAKCASGGLGITYNDEAVNMPTDQGCCQENDDDRLQVKADCEAMCQVMNPETKWGISPGSGSANGRTTQSFAYQKMRFNPHKEIQYLEFDDVTRDANSAFSLTYDSTPTADPGVIGTTTTSLTTNQDKLEEQITSALQQLPGINSIRTERHAEGKVYRITFTSTGSLFNGAIDLPNNPLPLLQTSVGSVRRVNKAEVLSTGPPRGAEAVDCPPDFTRGPEGFEDECIIIIFDEINFEGGKTAALAEAIQSITQGLITTILEEVVETVVLRDLVIKDLLIDLLVDLLKDLNEKFFDTWIADALANTEYDRFAPQPKMIAKIASMEGYNQVEAPKHKVQLFNMTDPDNQWMGYVKQAVDGLINFEPDENGNPPNDPLTPADIKLNDIINGIAKNDEGLVEIRDLNLKLMNGTDKFTKHYLEMTKLYIGGLNTFTLAEVLNPIEKYTISNILKLEKLSVEFDMRLIMWPSKSDETVARSNNDVVEEEFHISSMRLSDVTLDASILLAIDEYLAAGMKVGALYDNPVTCAPKTMHDLNISYFSLSAGAVDEPQVSQLIDPGTTVIVNAVSEFAFDSYGGLVLWLLPTMAQTTLKSKLQEILTEKLQGDCPDPPPYNPVQFIDYQTEKLVQTAFDLLNNNLLNDMDKVNDLVRKGTDNGKLSILDMFHIDIVAELGPTSELGIDIDLFDVSINNLDSFNRADLLQPQSPFVLRNYVEMAKAPEFDPMFVELHFNLTISKNPGCTDNVDPKFAGEATCGSEKNPASEWESATLIQNDFVLKLNMEHVKLLLEMTLKANKHRVKNLKLREGLTPICWYGTLDKSTINQFSLLTTSFEVDWECKNCGSQGFKQAETNSVTEAATSAMSKNFNKMLRSFTRALMGEESEAELAKKALEGQAVCNCQTNPDITVEGPAENMVGGQKQYSDGELGSGDQRRSASAVEMCVDDVTVTEKYGNDVAVSFPMDLIYGIGLLGFYILYRCVLWPLAKTFMDCSRAGSRAQWWENRKKKIANKKEEYDMFKQDRSLAFHPAVAPWMKIGVPIWLFTCIGMFMASHSSVLATIDIKMTLGGDVLNFKGFQVMMLKESLEQMWEAKVYSLFFILFGFSFLWPYIKLIGLLFCWFLPPWLFTSAKRGGFISLLDLLGKWSLIDIYVFIMIMSAFLMHIYSAPSLEPLIGLSFYQVDLQVTPMFGILASMIAGVLMPATNEVMIIAHRNAVSDTKDREFTKQLNAAADVGAIRGSAPSLDSRGASGGALDTIGEDNEDASRESEVIQNTYNPMEVAQSHRGRTTSTWFQAGTDDVKGFRKRLVDTRYALSHHVWENKGSKFRIALKLPGRFFVLAILFGPSLLAVWGGLSTAWSFDRDGLVGLLIDIGDEGADLTEYSVWNVGLILVKEQLTSSFLESFTILFCCFCCIAFAFVFPILQQLSMMYVWVKPMTLKELKIWYFVVEVCSGWATMDVFIISIFVCLMQVGMLSAVMIPPICQFLDPAVPYGFIDSKDARCFFVNAWLGPGTFLLFCGAISATFSLSFFQGACLAAIEDRENRIKGIDMTGDLNLGVSSKWAYFQFRIFKTLFLIDRSIKEEFRDIRQDEKNRRRAKVAKWKQKFIPGFLKKNKGENMEQDDVSDSREESDISFYDTEDDATRDSSITERESSIVLPPPRAAPQELLDRRDPSKDIGHRSRGVSKSGGRKKAKSRTNTQSSASRESFDNRGRESSIVAAPPRDPNSLPPGWTEQQHENGVYFWNFQTGVTTWERPKWGGSGEKRPPPAPYSEASGSFDEDDSVGGDGNTIQMKSLGGKNMV